MQVQETLEQIIDLSSRGLPVVNPNGDLSQSQVDDLLSGAQDFSGGINDPDVLDYIAQVGCKVDCFARICTKWETCF